jgi:hypothetical protein
MRLSNFKLKSTVRHSLSTTLVSSHSSVVRLFCGPFKESPLGSLLLSLADARLFRHIASSGITPSPGPVTLREASESIFQTRSESDSSFTDSSCKLFSTYCMQRSTTRIRLNRDSRTTWKASAYGNRFVRCTFLNFFIISLFMNRTDQQVLYHLHLKPDYYPCPPSHS